MTVKEILITASTLLERGDIKTYFQGGAVDDYTRVEEDANLLLDCYNLVEEQISTDYYRLKHTQSFTVSNGVIECKEFKYNPLAILKVLDKFKNNVDLEIKPDGIYTSLKYVEVTYSYLPSKKQIDGVSEFELTPISPRILAYGTVTEFCLIKGMYEEAVTWHNKFINSLTTAMANKKVKKIKDRKWL